MRLDKYLKVSRLIKRRTIANEACDNGRVEVNGRPERGPRTSPAKRVVWGEEEQRSEFALALRDKAKVMELTLTRANSSAG